MLTLKALFVWACLASVAMPMATDRPIIGILTLPIPQPSGIQFTAYFPASYVKFIESAGARVVPIHHKTPLDQLEELVSKLNGVLFTGGQDINDLNDSYYRSASKIVEIAMNNSVDRSEKLVLWGTCLGLETIVKIAAQNFSILSNVDANNISLNTSFRADFQDSLMFLKSNENSGWIAKELSRDALTYNAHSWGLKPEDFAQSSLLTENFKVLSTSFDRNGTEFVAIMEGRNNPVFTVQFHPEKSMFEWGPTLAIDHSGEAVEVMQYFADFLVDQSRLSGARKFESEEEVNQYLIGNYSPVFNPLSYFSQVYYFPDPEE